MELNRLFVSQCMQCVQQAIDAEFADTSYNQLSFLSDAVLVLLRISGSLSWLIACMFSQLKNMVPIYIAS